MASRLLSLTYDALDPARLADFWAALLGWDPATDPAAGISPRPAEVGGLPLRFLPTREAKTLQNRMHVEVTSETSAHQQETVDRALALGATHIDVGQRPEEGHVVLADPEGNELCVLAEGNGYLAGCGFFASVSCDGTREVGEFWSRALGWPLVWDEGEETAIQSPHGGTKISWGGPPLMPRPRKNRLHLDLVADDVPSEVDRLLGLGASRLDLGQGAVAWTVLGDPDGNELCVYPST